jgi:hypothetical protein
MTDLLHILANNRSGCKGVCWDNQRSKWSAEITCEGKKYHLGRFEELSAAAEAYADKAKELFGQFARVA